MKITPPRLTERPRSARRIIGPWTPEFGAQAVFVNPNVAVSNGTWPSASKPVAIPFRLSQAMIVDRLGWRNGTSPGSLWDIGIYDTAFNRKVSAGNTAGSGTIQIVDVTDTALPAGKYYLALVMNATTASRAGMIATTSSIPLLAFCGLMDSSTNASPLPDPLTNMVANTQFVRIPWFAIYGRDPF